MYLLHPVSKFEKIESGVQLFTRVFGSLEASVRFLATWHHVCSKQCGKQMHKDPCQDGFRFFPCWMTTVLEFLDILETEGLHGGSLGKSVPEFRLKIQVHNIS